MDKRLVDEVLEWCEARDPDYSIELMSIIHAHQEKIDSSVALVEPVIRAKVLEEYDKEILDALMFYANPETVIAINRFFPSTKMCSGCGQVHDMPLSKRVMDCDCGLVLNRDHNAAINILNEARNVLRGAIDLCPAVSGKPA